MSPRTFQGSPLRAVPGQVGTCISHTRALAESSTCIRFLPSGLFAPEQGPWRGKRQREELECTEDEGRKHRGHILFEYRDGVVILIVSPE